MIVLVEVRLVQERKNTRITNQCKLKTERSRSSSIHNRLAVCKLWRLLYWVEYLKLLSTPLRRWILRWLKTQFVVVRRVHLAVLWFRARSATKTRNPQGLLLIRGRRVGPWPARILVGTRLKDSGKRRMKRSLLVAIHRWVLDSEINQQRKSQRRLKKKISLVEFNIPMLLQVRLKISLLQLSSVTTIRKVFNLYYNSSSNNKTRIQLHQVHHTLDSSLQVIMH